MIRPGARKKAQSVSTASVSVVNTHEVSQLGRLNSTAKLRASFAAFQRVLIAGPSGPLSTVKCRGP